MPEIRLETYINADINLVFDLSRSIDLHQISTADTEEKVVGGRLSGLILLGEQVTWQARHFGLVQRLTSQITALSAPDFFVDEMQKGAFKSFKHEHIFRFNGQQTVMTDVFTYVSPCWIFGRIADYLFLEAYMKRLLFKRNQVVKTYAENGAGAELLGL